MIKRRFKITGGIVVLAVVGVTSTDYLLSILQPPPPSSFLTNTAAAVQSEPIKQSMFSSMLGEELNAIINESSHLDISVSVVDLAAGKQYDAGLSDTVFRGASTTKLITATAYLNEVDEGEATLEQYIDGIPAKQLIKQMIEDSDNEAWASLLNYLGDREQAYADSIGLNSYNHDVFNADDETNNTITAADEAKLLKLLYNGELISESNKELLLGYMDEADYEDLIKASLPPTAKVYHKYGMLYGNLHDTAIVEYQGRSFALVIFTKNPGNTLEDYSERVDVIHELTQTIIANLAI